MAHVKVSDYENLHVKIKGLTLEFIPGGTPKPRRNVRVPSCPLNR